MSNESMQVTIKLHVIGLIAAERHAPMPVTLAGVTVTLTETATHALSTPASICGVTDATGEVELRVMPDAKYLVEVQIGLNPSTMMVSSCDPITVRSGQIDYTRYVTLVDLTLSWSQHPDSHGTPIVPGAVLPYGKNVFLTLSGCAFLEEDGVRSSISADGVEAEFLGGSGIHRYALFTSDSGPLTLRVALGTIATRASVSGASTAVPDRSSRGAEHRRGQYQRRHASYGHAHDRGCTIVGEYSQGHRRARFRPLL